MVIDKVDREALISTILLSKLFPEKLSVILTKTRDIDEIISILRSGRDDKRRALVERVFDEVEKGVYHLVLYGESCYPVNLTELSDPPLLLFVRGNLPEGRCVAVIGGRRASSYGLQAATSISADLARSGIHIVSGLARGVDAHAHRAVVDVKGRTTAVLGSGLDRLYPSEHANLAQQILDHGGAIVTEYPPGTPPLPHHFPRRNRIISGMSSGVVVIEAGMKSGSLITARLAVEENRDVFVVPGPIFNKGFQGSHKLIQDGAKLVCSADDILEEYGGAIENSAQSSREIRLSEDEWTLFGILNESEPLHPDQIAELSGLPPATIGQCLLEMELKSIIIQVPGGLFLKKVI